MNSAEELHALRWHPTVIRTFGRASKVDLDAALVALMDFGRVSFGHPDDWEAATADIDRVCCALRVRDGRTVVRAHGDTALIAALRCLIRATEQLDADVSRGLHDMRAFLAD